MTAGLAWAGRRVVAEAASRLRFVHRSPSEVRHTFAVRGTFRGASPFFPTSAYARLTACRTPQLRDFAGGLAAASRCWILGAGRVRPKVRADGCRAAPLRRDALLPGRRYVEQVGTHRAAYTEPQVVIAQPRVRAQGPRRRSAGRPARRRTSRSTARGDPDLGDEPPRQPAARSGWRGDHPPPIRPARRALRLRLRLQGRG